MSEIKDPNPNSIGWMVPPTSPFMFEASDKTDLDIKHSFMGTDKFTVHRYLETYEKFVAPLKDKAKNILELGIWCGYSLLMWHDFFQQANIYGVDINEAPAFLKRDRITTYQQNAYDTSFIEKEFVSHNKKFDIIIDDGPHTPESWNFFVSHYLPLLNEGGVAIIEDIPGIHQATSLLSYASQSFKGKIYLGAFYTYNHKYDEHILIFTL